MAQAGSAFALGAKGRRFKSCLPDFDILVQHHKCFCDFAGTIRAGRVSIAKAVLPRLPPKGSLWENPVSHTFDILFFRILYEFNNIINSVAPVAQLDRATAF